MTVLDFRNKLISTIEKAPVPQGIRTETEFEKKFLIPVMLQVSVEFPGVRLYTHPWSNKIRCQPDCKTAPESGQVVAGCPRCWGASKKWASVAAFGTHHTFDASAIDETGETLLIEAKLIAAKGGRMPNGEIQRLFGQVTLAKTKHNFVLGVCGIKGMLDLRWDSDTEKVKDWFNRAGVDLVFLTLD